jgi:hypothetical protein
MSLIFRPPPTIHLVQHFMQSLNFGDINTKQTRASDAENAHYFLQEKHVLFSASLVRLCEVFLCQCWQNVVLYCVSVSASFVSYSNKLSSRKPLRSARQDSMFASAQFLRCWCEQRPSNQSGQDLSVVG